jgi:glycosyltransferase involved in cell wall biosynthesis
MDIRPYPRIAMLGAAPETRGSIAAVIDAYRAHGLFRRWPIDFLPTHGAGGHAQAAALSARALRDMALLLARHRKLVVHLHTGVKGLPRDAVFMSAALASRSPLVLQLHGGGFERYPHVSIARWFLERAACVVTPCDSVRAWVRSVARNAHAVTVPNPVAFDAQPAADEPRGNLVLFLGRMEAAKGIFDLLEALARLRAAVPDVRLVCAGDGERVAVARYAERLGIADAVRFTGWVGPSGKRALLEAAAVFALPSYDEAMPIGLLEAMAAGLPVVASPVGGIPEVVVDGVSGYLAAPGDIATLERLLRRLLVDRAHAARVGAAARESARLRFAPERTVPRLEEIYAAAGVSPLGALEAPALGLRKAA